MPDTNDAFAATVDPRQPFVQGPAPAGDALAVRTSNDPLDADYQDMRQLENRMMQSIEARQKTGQETRARS
jgi:hypothetical protein